MSSNKKQQPHYKQVKLLGQGSFGKAFLVVNTVDNKLYVIKTMILEEMNEKEQKEAYLEAKILEKLKHPNIIKFIEVFRSTKPVAVLNIVMDYADGGDMQKKIKEQKKKNKYFAEKVIIDWFTQICLALKHIHDKKILHRDLKSQNIFLTENGLIKLGDFGIAKCLNFTMEKASTIVGTPYYLSPEIVQNQPYSFKSDIWSLGVLLYEMMCLKMPFEASSLPLLSLKISRGAFLPVPSIYSEELRALVKQLLNVDASKRPSINEILSMNFIRKRIKDFLNEVEYSNEFSVQILENYNILQQGSKVTNEIQVIKNNSSNPIVIKQNSNITNSDNISKKGSEIYPQGNTTQPVISNTDNLSSSPLKDKDKDTKIKEFFDKKKSQKKDVLNIVDMSKENKIPCEKAEKADNEENETGLKNFIKGSNISKVNDEMESSHKMLIELSKIHCEFEDDKKEVDKKEVNIDKNKKLKDPIKEKDNDDSIENINNEVDLKEEVSNGNSNQNLSQQENLIISSTNQNNQNDQELTEDGMTDLKKDLISQLGEEAYNLSFNIVYRNVRLLKY